MLFFLPLLFWSLNTSEYYGYEVDEKAPSFTLKNTDGQNHSLLAHQGRFVILYFGYLNCDDVCHNQVGIMFNISQQINIENIDFLFIGLDPKRDSPENLKDYFNHLGSNFIALYHSDIREIQKVANKYNAPFFIDRISHFFNGNKDYEIQHPGYIYLIDTEGKLRLKYPNIHLRYDYIINDIKKIISKN